MEGNYEKILEKIASVSGLGKDEIERRVEAKRARLSGLISHEGAAQVVAAELGINFEKERLKVNELLSGMRKANVVGKVITLFPIRTFTTRKGEPGKVSNFILADDTSNIKVVLWDTNHIDLVEKGIVNEGTVIEIKNGSMRDNELHLGSFSEMKLSQEVFDSVVTGKVSRNKSIADFRVSDGVKNRAFIVQVFEPRFFYVCSECKKKVVSGAEGFICEAHGKIPAEKRALMNFVIDDGTDSIRAVAFSEALQSLGLDFDNEETLAMQKSSLLGKEMLFSGNVKLNKFFNNPELIIEGVNELDLDSVIADLEKD